MSYHNLSVVYPKKQYEDNTKDGCSQYKSLQTLAYEKTRMHCRNYGDAARM